MSTKIYDAYLYKYDIEKLMKDLKALRPAYNEHMAKQISEWIAPAEDRSEAYQYLLKKIQEVTRMGLNDPLNIEASIAVCFYKGKIYVKFFGIPQSLIETIDGLEDCHYQNSTDKPEGVTVDEWSTRRNLWDEIVPSGVFSEECLVFEYGNFYDRYKIAQRVIDIKLPVPPSPAEGNE